MPGFAACLRRFNINLLLHVSVEVRNVYVELTRLSAWKYDDSKYHSNTCLRCGRREGSV